MSKNNKIHYSLVIPVYNSEKSLDELFDRIKSTIQKLSYTFEIIFINDCSNDDSLEILTNLYKSNENVTVIDLHSNCGQQSALFCGFNYCKGRQIITLDDDLQNPPEEIPKLIEKMEEGYDMVVGTYINKKDTTIKKVGSYLFRKLNHRIFNVSNDIRFSSFRVIKREIIEKIKTVNTSYPYITGMILNVTRNVANVTVVHIRRKYGKSNYSMKSLFQVSFDLLINFSTIPIKLLGYLGITVSCVSFLLGIYFMIKQLLLGLAPPGWTSVIVMLSFFNTLTLLMFFTIGLYLSRLLREVANYEQFAIKKVMD